MANNTAKINQIIEKVCNEYGVYLYDLEFIKEGKQKVLRIYIDKDETGVFIDDCEMVSRKISEYLDEQNAIEDAYNLEVSSPGVERKLTQPWHYQKVIGKEIAITLYAPLNGQKNIIGKLTAYEPTIIIDDIAIEKDKISSARLHFDINTYLKNR